MVDQKSNRNVLFSAVKNEAPFIVEWIAYHKVIGFDRIIVFSNDCSDGTDAILDALNEAREILHIRHTPPAGVSAQQSAARMANEMGLLEQSDWVIWLDADEFLNIGVGSGQVSDLVSAISPCAGILISWRLFGDGGNHSFPGKFISPNFTSAASETFTRNREIKTFFRFEYPVVGFSEIGTHRPLLRKAHEAPSTTFLSGNGRPIESSSEVNRRWLEGEDFWRTSSVEQQEHGYKFAQINHYCVRTPEYFLLKKSRGRGFLSDQSGSRNRRHTPMFYMRMNRNGSFDDGILRFSDQVDMVIKQLVGIENVQCAISSAQQKVQIAIDAIPRDDIEQLCKSSMTELEAAAPMNGLDLPLSEKERDLLVEHFQNATNVLVYGGGHPSIEALANGCSRVISVECDKQFSQTLQSMLADTYEESRFHIHYEDIGVTGDWGFPDDSSHSDAYYRYPTSIWDSREFEHPDVVVINGRFKAACFLTTISLCQKETRILFSRYARSEAIHWIERYFRPIRYCDEIAEFVVSPTMFSTAEITRIVSAYSDPR
ncbi:glycosyltransferase family 2 protein [Rhizobium rhizogenes]|uniref:Glycosyltransferase protein n=1 Tax=Rhizobium rhizogenes (strain K84 / ATCC BAA-868) TaxID=311403 RepID=B9JPV1_RHIR8|nr:conserved hypothetical protein [Rhizobium rhizogenes K84]